MAKIDEVIDTMTFAEAVRLQRVLHDHCTKVVDDTSLDILRKVEAWLDKNHATWRQL